MRTFISRLLIAAFVASVCWIFPDTAIFAELSNSSFSTIDCRMAPNPDQCFIDQNKAKEQQFNVNSLIPLNTSSLGWNGPFSAALKYDNDLGWIFGLGYLQMITESAGLAVKLALGANERRVNLTAGYAPHERHQFKLTYEYLTQNLPYTYESGFINEWVNQQALGGAYQYLLGKQIAHSLELSGSYIKANSKNLSDIVFYEGDDPYLNLRRIAGGEQATFQATLNLVPFQNTLFALGGGYSQVDYDTQYETAQNNQTFAYKAELTHLVTPKTKLVAAVNNTAANRDVSAQVSKILPKNVEVSLKGQHSQGYGGQPSASSVMLGMSYPAPKSYALKGLDSLQELKNWIDKPVIYEARVLAVKDEMVKEFYIGATDIPDQTQQEGGNITAVDTANYFKFDSSMYDQVSYTYTTQPITDTVKALHTPSLNLSIKQNNNYEATLSSAEPLPQGSMGQYKVTLTANGMRSGLKQPVVENASFILTVTSEGPVWTTKNLPAGPMGLSYPDVDLSNGYATSDVSNDSLTFQLVSGPEWIKLKEGHILTAADNKLVPQIPAPQLVILKAINKANQSSQKTFKLNIEQDIPKWDPNNNYQSWIMEYDDTSNGILLTPFIISGTTNLTFSFEDNQLTSGNWIIINQNGASFLRRNTPATPTPNDMGQTVTLDIIAHNTTSTLAAQQKESLQPVQVKVTEDQDLPAPTWVKDSLSANAGDTAYKVALSPLVNGSVSNDSYSFQLTTDSQSNWLSLSDDGQYLIAIAPVPPIGTNGSGTVKFKLNATSDSSGKPTGDTEFTLTVSNFAPQWLNVIPQEKVTLPFDASLDNDQQPGILLNDLIAQNTTNLRFAFSADGKNMNSGIWQIVPKNGSYFLKFVTSDTSNITYQPPPVTIYALNSTSNVGIDEPIQVTVIADNSLAGPQWKSTIEFEPATSGDDIGNYKYSLKNLFDCPQNDSCTIQTNADIAVLDPDTHLPWIELSPPPLTQAMDIDLVNKKVVPRGDADPQGNSHSFWVKITSISSGKTIERSDFRIPIISVLPVWIDKPAVDLPYDGTGTAVDMRNYISSGDDNLSFDFSDKSYAQNWKINQQYFLQRQSTASLDDIGNTISVPIQAMNSTSVNGDSGAVKIHVIANDKLGAPKWTSNSLPQGNMGYPYGSLDLNTLVQAPANPDVLSYSFVGSHPDWLTLQNCPGNNQGTSCLAPVGNIPTSAGNQFTVTIHVVSKASGLPAADQVLSGSIKETPVEWVSNPQGSIVFNDLVNGIALEPFIQAGQGNPNGDAPILTFTTSSVGWAIKENNGQHFLVMTDQNPNYNDAEKVGQVLSPVITASNNTSVTGKDQAITVTLSAASGIAPVWNDHIPKDANAQDTSYQVRFCELVDDGKCTQNYNFYLVTSSGTTAINGTDIVDPNTWLALDNSNHPQQLQLNAAAVPTANIDPPGSGVVSFSLKVQNQSTALYADNTQGFSFKVNNLVPVWDSAQDYDNVTLPYDVGSAGVQNLGLELSKFITTNGGSSLNNFVFKDSNSAISSDQKWEISKDSSSNEYYLHPKTADINNIGSSNKYTIIAKNTTSQNGAEKEFTVSMTADQDLGNPQWKSSDLPEGNMGYPYSTVDLNALVQAPISGDVLTYSFVGSHPSWLDLKNCTVNGQGSVCLVPVGNIPTTAGDQFSITIRVTSKASGTSAPDQILKASIKETPVEWASNPQGSIVFNDLVNGIALEPFIQTGQGNPNGDAPILTFTTSSVGWAIKENNGRHFLVMTDQNPNYNDAEKVGQVLSPTVTASNNTSITGKDQVVAVTLNAASGTAPAWNDRIPKDANAQDTSYQVRFCELVDDGKCTQNYNFYLVTNSGATTAINGTDIVDPNTWLAPDNSSHPQQLQLTTTTVPTADVDPPSAGVVTFTLKVQSQSTALYANNNQSFSFKVNNLVPVWDSTQDYSQFTLPYDAGSAGVQNLGLELSKFITVNGGSSLNNFVFKDSNSTVSSDQKWEISKDSSSNKYYLHPKTADINNIGSSNKYTVVAKNTTSQNGAEKELTLSLTGDADLGQPQWTSIDLPKGDMGYPYGTVDLNAMVQAPASGDVLTYSFVGSHPSWLDLKNCTVNDQGSVCLVPVGNIPTTAGEEFSITVHVSSKASGTSAPDQVLKGKIEETPVVWTSNPQGSIVFNDLVNGVVLEPLILAGQGNPTGDDLPALKFSTSSVGWAIKENNGQHFLVMTDQNPNYNDAEKVGQVLSPVVTASNNTSITGKDQVVAVTLDAVSGIAPVWNDRVPKDANAQDKNYQIRFCELVDDGKCTQNYNFYLVTSNGTTAITGTDIVDPNTWLTPDSANHPQQLSAATVATADVDPPASGVVNFSLKVQSQSTALYAKTDQSFSFKVNNLVPKWTQDIYSYDRDYNSTDKIYLNDLVSNNLDLAIDYNSADTGENFDSNYWTLKKDDTGYYLQRSAAGQWTDTSKPFPTDGGKKVRIPLIASNSTSKQAVSTQGFYVNVAIPSFNWATDQLPQSATALQAGQNFAPARLNSLGLISGGITGDTYSFSIVGSSQIKNGGSCTITKASGADYPDQLTCSNVQATDLIADGGVFKLTLQAQSNITQSFATTTQEFKIVVHPGFVNDNNKISIQFDDLQTGVKLNQPIDEQTAAPLIYNPNNLPISCALTQPSSTWKLVTAADGSGVSSCYVKRNLNANNQVDASDVNQDVNLPIKITYGSNVDTSPSTLTSNIVAHVNPDSNLTYRYIGGTTQVISAKDPLPSPNVDQTDPNNTSMKLKVDLTPGSFIKAYTPTSVGAAYEVIGDNAYTFSNPGGAPSYLDFTNINQAGSQQVNFFWAAFADFGKGYPSSPLTWNLNVKSAANGSKDASVSSLPGVIVSALTLTPPTSSKGAVTNLGSMTYGGFNIGSSTSCNISNYGYLNVQKLPTGSHQLKLTNIAITYPGTTGSSSKWQTVCQGVANDKNIKSYDTCPAGSQKQSYKGTENNGSDILTPDANGDITFLPTLTCVNSPSSNFSTFTGNIRLELTP